MKSMCALLGAATLILVTLGGLTAAGNQAADTLKIDVDLVLIPTTVTNSRGQFVGGLDREHFTIYEDQIAQDIAYFSTEDAPMSLGIVLDTSGSMDPVLASARRNGGGCLDIGALHDEYFLVLFSDRVSVTTDFTTDIRSLQSRLLTVRAKGGTALYDAVYAGLARLREGINARKALVVVSDGYENHSRYSAGNVREAVKESDVQVYSIGNEADSTLRQLSDITGGRSLSARSHSYALGTICSQVVRELKNQYLIGYRPTNLSRDGKWRRVRVKLDTVEGTKLSVRSRTGYYAPAE